MVDEEETVSASEDNRTRVTRPDTSVLPELVVDDNAPAADAATEAVVTTSEASTGEPRVNFVPPYKSAATQVVDSIGRVVCNVGSEHLTLAQRVDIATYIASKLNPENISV